MKERPIDDLMEQKFPPPPEISQGVRKLEKELGEDEEMVYFEDRSGNGNWMVRVQGRKRGYVIREYILNKNGKLLFYKDKRRSREI